MSDTPIRLVLQLDQGQTVIDATQLGNSIGQSINQGIAPAVAGLGKIETLLRSIVQMAPAFAQGFVGINQGIEQTNRLLEAGFKNLEGMTRQAASLRSEMAALKVPEGAYGGVGTINRRSSDVGHIYSLSPDTTYGRTNALRYLQRTAHDPDRPLGAYRDLPGAFTGEDLANAVLGQISRQGDAENARAAQITALQSAAVRRSELAGYSLDEGASDRKRRALTEAAINRYTPTPDSRIDDLTDSIFGYLKNAGDQETANTRAAEKSRIAGERAAAVQEREASRMQSQAMREQEQIAREAAKAAEESARRWKSLSPIATSIVHAIQEPMDALLKINQVGGRLTANVIGMPSRIFQAIGNEAIRLSAIFYSFERIGRLAGRVTLGPIESIVGASEEAQKFQLSIAGTVGGLGQAQAIDNALIGRLGNSPYTLAEARQSAQISSRVASLVPGFGLGTTQQAAGQVQSISELIARLQVGNPEKTGEEIGRVIQQVLEGNTRGIRQLGISPADLEARMGMTQKELSGNQQAILQALNMVAHERVPDQLMNARMMEPSFLVERIKDLFTVAMQRVGDSGLYQEVGEKLQALFTRIFDYIQSSQFMARAQEIGESMGRVLDGVAEAGAKLLKALSGSDTLADTPDAVAKQVVKITSALGDFAQDLPAIAKIIGENLRDLAAHLKDVAYATEHPVGRFVSGAQNDAAQATMSQVAPLVGAINSFAPFALNNFAGIPLLPMQSPFNDQPDNAAHQDLVIQRLNELRLMGGRVGRKGNPDFSTIEDLGRRSVAQRASDVLMGLSDSTLRDSDLTDYYLRSGIKGWETLLSDAISGDMAGRVERRNFTEGPLPGIFARSGAAELSGADPDYFYSKLSASRAFQSLENMSPKTQEPFAETLQNGSGYLNALDKLPQMLLDFQSRRLDELNTARGTLEDDVNQIRDPEVGGRVLGMLMQLDSAIENLQNGVPAAMNRFNAERANFGQGLNLQSALQLPTPGARAAALTRLNVGSSSPFFDVASGALTGSSLEAIKSNPAFMQLLLSGKLSGMSAEQIAQYVRQNQVGVADSVFGPGTASMTIDVLSQARSGYSNQLNELQKKANPSEEDRNRMAILQDAIGATTEKIRELQTQTNEATANFVKFGESARSSITEGLGNALFDVITKTKNVSQAFREMANSILHSFTNMVSSNLTNSLFGDLMKGGSTQMGGLLGLLFRGGGSAAGTGAGFGAGAGAGDTVVTGGAEVGAADGGIFAHGLHFFAGGGIARRPTLAVVGERGDGTPEGVIPLLGPGHSIPLGVDGSGVHAMLPGGRKIAASFFASGGVMGGNYDYATGGGLAATGMGGGQMGSMELRVYNVSSIEEAMAKGYDRAKGHILNEVHKAAAPGGSLRRALKRPT